MIGATSKVEHGATVAPLLPDRAIPWVVRPQRAGDDLAEWARRTAGLVDTLLLEHRALLFRGFSVRDLADFERFVRTVSTGEPLEYRDRSTPRETRGARIYTSTIYPPDQTIHLHNEGTYWLKWAAKLFFCCLKTPERGGATPIADVRRVHDRIDPDVRRQFLERAMMLVRNYNDGFGLPWEEVFQTSDKGEVERYCRSNDIAFEWKSGDRLRTKQVRPAIRHHPRTGEPVWFNHAAFFHVTSLPPDMARVLLDELGEEGLPYNTCFGDGGSIDESTIEHIRAAYLAEKVVFDWEEGDVMLLDNMSVAHGREPYAGEREVVVSMTEPCSGASP